MHTAEPVSKFFWKNIRQGIDSQAGCIAGKHCVRRYEGGDLAIQVLLPVHSLGNRLNDQIAAAQELQAAAVIRRAVVGRDDGVRQRLARKWGR